MRWIVAALALLLVSAGQAFADPLVGRAAVIDGDTIDIAGERVRFNGVDAPESDQVCRDASGADWRCGQQSAFALDAFLAESRPTRCEFIERDRYGRFVGDCYRDDGASVAEWLVRNGWALDWPRYSGGAYADAQTEAKAQGHGIWQGDFVAPWDWRAGDRLVANEDRDTADTGECLIKGNINSKGDRIYHVPGSRYYSRTKINRPGERWFCTEEEARQAAWRAPLR